MSANLDSILDKLTNENWEINCRAMLNLHSKVENRWIALDTLSERMIEKYLISLCEWFSMYLNNIDGSYYTPELVLKTLSLFKRSVEVFPASSIQNLKAVKKVSNLINDVGQISNVFRGSCDEILQVISRTALSSSMSDYHSSANNFQGKGNPNLYTDKNTGQINANSNNSNVSWTYSQSKPQNTSTYQEKMISEDRQNPVMAATSNSNKTNNSHSGVGFPGVNQQEIPIQISHSTHKTTRANHCDDAEIKSTFPKIDIPEQEEQFIFDLGINLKFGDSLQIYKSLYIFYTQIWNDYPIEYIWQLDELLKSFFRILVTCNFLEFGTICHKILSKILLLINQKILLYISSPSSLLPNSAPQKTITIIRGDSSPLISVENFLLYSLSNIIESIHDSNKLSLYVNWLQTNYNLFTKIFYNATNYYEVWYDVWFSLDKLVIHYKNKNLDAINLFEFCLRIYLDMPDKDLVTLVEMSYDATDTPEIEPIHFIRDILFIINSPNKTVWNALLNKLTMLKDCSPDIEAMWTDYKNASLIHSSINISKDLLCGQMVDIKIIIENFYNILLSLKFLSNNPYDDSISDFENIFQNSTKPWISAVCDYYLINTKNNLTKSTDLLIKWLSFRSNGSVETRWQWYEACLNEIKTKGSIILHLFYNETIFNIFLSDWVIDTYEGVILDILFTMYITGEPDSTNKKFIEFRKSMLMLPPFIHNFKFSSLQSKIDSTLTYDEIMIKYIRFLFHKDENVRYSAINFFSNNPNNNAHPEIKNISDNSELKSKYAEFKSSDTLLLIQTATNEILKVIKNIDDELSVSIEFIPILNIFYSTKMDFNIKTSAIEQLILLIKNNNYKNYYLSEILTVTVKELLSNENNVNKGQFCNYITSLIKLLSVILLFHYKEERIQNFLIFKNSQEWVHILLGICSRKDKSKHLMASYATWVWFFFSFNDGDNMRRDEVVNSDAFPIWDFFDKYYYTHLIPTTRITMNYSGNKPDTEDKGWLNFTITKSIVDYIYYKKSPLIPIYNVQTIKANIKKLKNLSLWDVFISITQVFSYYSLYQSYGVDISDSLVQIMFYLKKIMPTTLESKNLIMDTWNIFDLFIIATQNETQYDNIFVPFFQDFIGNNINYITITKDFLNNWSKSIDDQNFVYENIEFLIRNPKFFSVKKIEIFEKFIDTYSNIFVFNQENNYYSIKLHLIKFQSMFMETMVNIKSQFNEKLFSDTVNTISFFLTKYEPCYSYYNLNYISWTLNFLWKLIKGGKCREIIKSKSFIFIKLLQSPFIEINILSIQLLTLWLDMQLFEKHSTWWTDIYNSIKWKNNKIVLINFYSFLIKSFEFILSKKEIDPDLAHTESNSNADNKWSNELLAINEGIYRQSELIELLTISSEYDNSNNANGKYDSIQNAMRLKYIDLSLNIDMEDVELKKGFFFNFTFYDHLNDIIIKEITCLTTIVDIDLDASITINTHNNIICDEVEDIYYSDCKHKNNWLRNSCNESILNIKECINWLIRSFPWLAKENGSEVYERYKSNISEIFLNLVTYSRVVIKCWSRWYRENNMSHIMTLQSYALKYFSFLQFVFDSRFTLEAIELRPQEWNNICYDLMKFDFESKFNTEWKTMFGKVLPWLIELNNKIKHGGSLSKIKNEGDILLEWMNSFKTIYEVKCEVFGSKVKCHFNMDEMNVKMKNDIINAISSLLLTSQVSKKIFVKSKFLNTFVDYIKCLSEANLSFNIEKSSASSTVKRTANVYQIDSVLNTKREINNAYTKYIKNEYCNILILWQNLLCSFDACDERDEVFIRVKSGAARKSKFLKLLYDIFFDTGNHPALFDNYLKLLINILSNSSGVLSKYFLVPITKNKDIWLSIILEHFTKSIQLLASNPNFELYIKFMKCLLQYRPISLYLWKTKFNEILKEEVIKWIHNKKTFSQPKQIKLIECIMEIFVSLGLDSTHAKRLANKEFVLTWSEVLIRTKNEEVIYNVLFFYRNVAFVNAVKNIFMSNETLLGTIFALFNNESSIKVLFIISHLIWVLLYNNQTLRSTLNKEEFKNDLKGMNIHLQKELDMEKLGEEKKSGENGKYGDNKRLWEETCLNMRKIMHIIEM